MTTENENRGDSFLDKNLQRLLSVAPEPARLDATVKARIVAALQEAQGPCSAPDDSPLHRAGAKDRSTRRRATNASSQRPLPRLIGYAAAAALLLAVGVVYGPAMVQRLVNGAADSPRGIETASGTGRAPGGTEGGPGRMESTPAVGGTGKETLATAADDAAAGPDGDRESLVASGAAPGNDAAQAASTPVTPGDVVAEILIPKGPAAGPGEATLWIKPVVNLPAIADAIPHDIPLTWVHSETAAAGPDGPRSAHIHLDGVLAVARSLQAREVVAQLEVAGFGIQRRIAAVEEGLPIELEFELEAGQSVVGHVVDAGTGTPLEGALVVALDQLPIDALDVHPDPGTRLPRPWTRTDAAGSFTLAGLGTSDAVQIRASHPDFAPAFLPVDLGNGDANKVELALTGGSRVFGTCERPDGTRFSGGFVIVTKQDGDPFVAGRIPMTFGGSFTDASGEYEVNHLPAGLYVALLFESEGLPPIQIAQVRLKATGEQRLDFLAGPASEGASFEGLLRLPDGSPLAAANLTLTPTQSMGPASTDWRGAETDGDGRFRFSGLDAGRYELHLAEDGYQHLSRLWSGDIDGPTRLEIGLPDTRLTLEVTRSAASLDGQPPGEAWAILESAEGDAWTFAGRGRSNADGQILFTLLPEARYRAIVIGSGGDEGSSRGPAIDLRAGQPESQGISLPAGGSVELSIVDAADGSPVPGARVEVRVDGLEVPQHQLVRTGPDGQARCLGVPHGPIEVQVTAAGYSSASRFSDFAQGAKTLRIELSAR